MPLPVRGIDSGVVASLFEAAQARGYRVFLLQTNQSILVMPAAEDEKETCRAFSGLYAMVLKDDFSNHLYIFPLIVSF